MEGQRGRLTRPECGPSSRVCIGTAEESARDTLTPVGGSKIIIVVPYGELTKVCQRRSPYDGTAGAPKGNDDLYSFEALRPERGPSSRECIGTAEESARDTLTPGWQDLAYDQPIPQSATHTPGGEME